MGILGARRSNVTAAILGFVPQTHAPAKCYRFRMKLWGAFGVALLLLACGPGGGAVPGVTPAGRTLQQDSDPPSSSASGASSGPLRQSGSSDQGDDQDGDGVGDRPYRLDAFSSRTIHKYPAAVLLLRSPALELLAHLEERLPVLKVPTVVDWSPLMRAGGSRLPHGCGEGPRNRRSVGLARLGGCPRSYSSRDGGGARRSGRPWSRRRLDRWPR